MKRKLLIVLALLVVVGALAFFFVVPAAFERRVNGTRQSPPYAASERARALHRTLLVADLHADSLLWDRDLLERAARGHVDIPRLAEGGVALQNFTVVTKVPFG
ncbi:MAG: peptidase M19, partial [Acidobacteria bacterium]